MPRNPDAPRASEVHWISEEEKQAALALIPEGESFSNYVRRKLFKKPTLQHGGARKTQMISEEILQMCESKGAQWAALARNYRAAKSNAHRQKIADTIMQNATGEMWISYYQNQSGRRDTA